MTATDDAVAIPEARGAPWIAGAPAAPPLDENVDLLSLSQEINARRARVENAELLQHLRGL